jgi:hypothetical protein
MQVGDVVKVLAPFNEAFPDVYAVEAVKPDGTCVIAGDRDFDPVYLEKI